MIFVFILKYLFLQYKISLFATHHETISPQLDKSIYVTKISYGEDKKKKN